MSADGPRVLRALNPSERAMWRLSSAASLNFVTIARVRGSLTPSVLRSGLATLQARHPLLRATIDGRDTRNPRFVADAAPPISLRVATDGDWRGAVEHELYAAFDTEAGPLARAVWVPFDGGGRVLFTLHHAIGDGWSGVYAVRDLLRACAGAATGHDDPSLVPIDAAPSVLDRLPASHRGVRGAGRVAGFVAGELWGDARLGRVATLPAEDPAGSWERRALWVPVELDAEFTRALAEKARREGTTVHGALLAAQQIGVAAANGGRVKLKCGSPVNLRPSLDPPVGEDVGVFVSVVTHRDEVTPDADLWALARSVRASIVRAKDVGRPLCGAYGLGLLETVLRARGASGETFARRFEGAFTASTGLTNLGRLGVETAYGAFTLEAAHFAVNPSALGTYVCTATSTRGQLNWNFMFASPTFSAATAAEVVASTVDRLRAAVGGASTQEDA